MGFQCVINPALGYVPLKDSGSILKEIASLDLTENVLSLRNVS